MKQRPKICIGIPQPDTTHHWFQDSLWNLICSNTGEMDIYRYNAVGSVIVQNRNRIIKTAQEIGATHVLQIDADSVFPPNALVRLLAHDLPIVGATTCKRTRQAPDDGRPLCEPLDKSIPVTKENPVIKVSLVGMNFMLIKLSVFDKLRRPYFATPPRWMVTDQTHAPDGTEMPELVAEDEYFCNRAREAGYDIYCDMLLSMEMGHIGSTIYHIEQPSQRKPMDIVTA